MAIPRKQIGWSQESNLLWEISRQMEKLTGVAFNGGGGGSALTIKDDGTTLTTGATSIDFTGAGVTASATGTAVTVNIPGGGGGGVESVTGLNTDNTDPLNPIVQISVDGTTITGDGTPGNPLVSSGGSGTVSVDGLTIGGDGSSGNPLYSKIPVYDDIDLQNGSDYTAATEGIYQIVNGTNLTPGPDYYFYFPDPATLPGKRIVIINKDVNGYPTSIIASIGNIFYRGTSLTIYDVPAGASYEFVSFFDGTNWAWSCITPVDVIIDAAVDISTTDYYMKTYGVYEVTVAGGFSTSMYFPDPFLFKGEKITIINKDFVNAIPFKTILPLYQGTSIPVDKMPIGMSYDFISDGVNWICKAPTPVLSYGDLILNAPHTLGPNGFYAFTSSDGVSAITFPHKYYSLGQRIVVINQDPTNSILIDTTNRPKDIDGTPLGSITPMCIYEFICVGNEWYILSQRCI